MPRAHDRESHCLSTTRELVQGSPVLSVCWLNNSLLSASDIAGRCLLCDIDKESLPHNLETTEGLICCLLNLGDDILAGLSSEGKLLFWQISIGKLVEQIDVTPPPPIRDLVRMVYWSEKKTLVHIGINTMTY